MGVRDDVEAGGRRNETKGRAGQGRGGEEGGR